MNYLASIDIGVRNLAFTIQSYDINKLNDLANETVPKNRRFNKEDGTSTEEYSKLLNKIYVTNQVEHCELFDLLKVAKVRLDNEAYLKLFDWMEENKQHWDKCDTIIIECQVVKNFKAGCLQHSLVAWLLMTYRTTKNVVVFPSKHKTQVLGAPQKVQTGEKWKKVTKHFRKTFAKNKTKQILLLRNDTANSKLFFETHKQKSDDLSDTVCQAQAYLLLRFIDKQTIF